MKSAYADPLSFGDRRRKEDSSRSAPRHRKKPLFEALEARVLLSADISHVVGAGEALSATLRVMPGESGVDPVLELVNNADQAILCSRP